jgi:predicted TIM-barrel fold metal-dependent hydrolase
MPTSSARHGVVSADCHLDPEFLPRDTFTTRVSAAGRDMVPQVRDVDGDPTWLAGDVRLGPWGTRRVREILAMGRRGALMLAAGFDPDQFRPTDPLLRVEDQEKDGVDAEVMYGPLRRWGYLAGLDAATAATVVRAYNSYIAEFCAAQPGRLYAHGGVPPRDVDAIVAAIAQIAELGLAGAELPMLSSSRPLWDPEWEPLWAAAVEYDVPLHIHVQAGSLTQPGPQSALVERAVFVCGVPLQLHPTLTAVLLSGILERHPRLKVVMAEAGTGWIPYLLDRIDYEWENAHAKWRVLCSERPSELFRRQMFATFQQDAIGPQLAHLYPASFMWGSDYPHADCIWPDSREIIQRTMGTIGDDLRKKLTHDNAAALYGLP